MADILSQDDLDALWTSNPNGEVRNGEPEFDSSAGVSQGDLDALFADLGGLSGNAAASGPSASEALSQADLDAFRGELKPAAGRLDPTPVAQDESSGPRGASLSQDDIDLLLAEMGR